MAHVRLQSLPVTMTIAVQDELALEALNMGDVWEAENEARAVLAYLPKDRQAHLTLAASLRRQAHFEAAIRLYQQLLKQDQRDSDAYLGMADTLFLANQRSQAFTWLSRAAAEGAQTPLSLTTIAHRYQDWKDYPRAEATVAKALQIAPDNIDALQQKASIEVEGGKLEAGYQTLTMLLEKNAKDGFAHRLLGVVLMNSNSSHYDLNRARTLLERAVELDAKDAAIYRAAAVIYRQQHLYRLAAQAYDALLHLDPTSLEGRYGLGQVYALLGKKDLSRQQLALYKRLDERQQRVTRLTEETVHHPADAPSHFALAQFMESSGDYANALPQYQIAAGLAPKNAVIQQKLRKFYVYLGWKLPIHKTL